MSLPLALKEDRDAHRCFALVRDCFSGSPLSFKVRLWNDSSLSFGSDEPLFTLVLKHPGALRRMFLPCNQLTLGEAYIFKDFEIEGNFEYCFQLADHLLDARRGRLEKLSYALQLLGLPERRSRNKNRVRLRGRLHSRHRDRQAVTYHYDLSNDFYRLWLDSHLIYSCAYFKDPEDALDQAQEQKLDYLCRKLRLRKGERLLDIGCGWGGLILHAARHYGVEAVGITLSQPQADLANERSAAEGLASRCRAEVRDYRSLEQTESFDKIVSVGMFEHVGRARLPEYFAQAYRLLRQGGIFLNHGITESQTQPPPRGPSFIDRYVFPDGDLLPIAVTLNTAEATGFEVRDLESLREHYALTLQHWVRRLEKQKAEAIRIAGETTYRIWRLYMAGSAHGFRTGRMNLYQALFVKTKGPSDLPLTRADWYS